MAESSPRRVQRKRTAGSRLPEGAVCVTRPGRWGNPAKIGAWCSVGPQWREADRCTMSTVIRTPQDAASFYRCALWYGGMVVERNGVRVAVPVPSVEEIRAELPGKTLACWCREEDPCHGEVLLAIANSSAVPSWLDSGDSPTSAAFMLTHALGLA